MDSPRRSWLKALTWQLLGLLVSTGIGAAFTGSVAQGAGLAMTLALVGLVLYVVHERLWGCIAWGRPGSEPPPGDGNCANQPALLASQNVASSLLPSGSRTKQP